MPILKVRIKADRGLFVMKINSGVDIQKIMGAYGKTTKQVKKTKTEMVQADKIEISSQAREFQVAMKALKALPDIREEKVSAVRDQMKKSAYAPSSDDVAQKILDRIGVK